LSQQLFNYLSKIYLLWYMFLGIVCWYWRKKSV